MEVAGRGELRRVALGEGDADSGAPLQKRAKTGGAMLPPPTMVPTRRPPMEEGQSSTAGGSEEVWVVVMRWWGYVFCFLGVWAWCAWATMSV